MSRKKPALSYLRDMFENNTKYVYFLLSVSWGKAGFFCLTKMC